MSSGGDKRGTIRGGGAVDAGLGSDFVDRGPGVFPNTFEKTDRQEVPSLSDVELEALDGEGTEAEEDSAPENATEFAAQAAEVAELGTQLGAMAADLIEAAPSPFVPATPAPLAPSLSGSGSSSQRPGEDPWIGRMLANRYAVERVIAAGGMGRVYLATQMPLGRPVAIKVVRTEIQGSRQQFLRRFFLEASACARLTHPNIITIHDYGEAEDGNVFMAMEYLDGRSLDKEIKDTAPMTPERALHITIQVSRALREAHGKGIIHRDLKPQNVMLMEQGDERDFVKVLDFGLVKMLSSEEEKAEAELTRAGVLLGSPNYMSPEQILGGTLDHRSDIYSLGVVLFKMLAGKNPFTRDAETDVIYKHVYHPAPTLASLGIVVPPVVEALVAKCLAKKASDRFASCKELVIALKDARREVMGQAPRKKKKKREEVPEQSQDQGPSVIVPAPPPELAQPAPEPAKAAPQGPATQDLPPTTSLEPPKPEPPMMPSVPPPRLASVPPRGGGPSIGFRLSDGSSARGVPTRVYLRSSEGEMIGPLPLGQVEILYYARVVDENTPLSSDGISFEAISTNAKLYEHLQAYRQAIRRGPPLGDLACFAPRRRCAQVDAGGLLSLCEGEGHRLSGRAPSDR